MSTHIEEMEVVLQRMNDTSEYECIEECILELDILCEQYLLHCLHMSGEGYVDE